MTLLSHLQAVLQQKYLLLVFILHLVSPHSWLQMAMAVGKLLLGLFWVRQTGESRLQTNECEDSTFVGVGSVAWQKIWHHHFWFYTTVWIGVNIREGLSRICCLTNRQDWLQQNLIFIQISQREPLFLSDTQCWITDLQDQRPCHQSTCDLGVNQ